MGFQFTISKVVITGGLQEWFDRTALLCYRNSIEVKSFVVVHFNGPAVQKRLNAAGQVSRQALALIFQF